MSDGSRYQRFPLQVKICGLTRVEDLSWSIRSGADYLGTILCTSPRQVSLEQAQELLEAAREFGFASRLFAVVQDPELEQIAALQRCGFSALQLHGKETPEWITGVRTRFPTLRIWKGVHVSREEDLQGLDRFPVDAVLVDSKALDGAGESGGRIEIAPESVRKLGDRVRIVLAGGLGPESAIDAVIDIEPWAVDVSSGVETSPGIKDRNKIESFIGNAKKAASLRAYAARKGNQARGPTP